MRKANRFAICAGAAITAPLALYAGFEIYEANNNHEVQLCAAALGDVATVAAQPPEDCKPNESEEYNGFVYHVSTTKTAGAKVTTAYYDIPSVDDYLSKATIPEYENMKFPFSEKEIFMYMAVATMAGAAAMVLTREHRTILWQAQAQEAVSS